MSNAADANAPKKPWLTPSRRRAALTAGGVIAVLALGLFFFKPDKTAAYRTEAARRADVTRTVSVSGSLEALDTVTIGSQLSGQVIEVPVDFNSQVKKGQVLAIIDTQTYASRVQQNQAALDSARADLKTAAADLQRQNTLRAADLVSQQALEAAVATRDKAAAQVKQASATLASSQTDLGRARITAPIDGVIINRTVDPGQTVAASLSAPELFVMAKDLSQLEINLQVDEADVGEVREGQIVRFTVDAFPDESFEGRVTQVRKQPTKVNNVVTYSVMAQADNPQRKLFPGMTANADIVIDEHPDVLVVSNTALRWRPASESQQNRGGQQQQRPQSGGGAIAQQPEGVGGARGNGGGGRMNPERIAAALSLDATQKKQAEAIFSGSRDKMRAAMAEANGDRDAARAAMRKISAQNFDALEKILRADQKTKLATLRAEQGGRARLSPPRAIYLLVNNKPKAVQVRTGATDGSITEVSGEIKEGDLVITGGGPQPKAQQNNRNNPMGVPGMGGPAVRRF